MKNVTVTARAKAFRGQSVREHRFLVSGSSDVMVWDPVAGYYTLCHSLSPAAERRIRRMAREVETEQAQCLRCGLVRDRRVFADDGTTSSRETADRCPRCDHDRVQG